MKNYGNFHKCDLAAFRIQDAEVVTSPSGTILSNIVKLFQAKEVIVKETPTRDPYVWVDVGDLFK